MKLSNFLKKANSVLNRLDLVLPEEPDKTDWNALAYRWHSVGKKGILESLPNPHTFPLDRLAAVGTQTEKLKRNTEQFLAGRSANNVLMSGSRGTGKSSLVKALLHEYAKQGLRLIEVDTKGNRTLLETEVVKEAVAEITEVGTKVESRVQPLDGVKDLTISNPALVIEEEKVAYGHEERVNPSLKAGERRIVQAGVEGQTRRLIEVDTEGNRSLKGTELIKETVTKIVEIGPKVDVQDDKPLAPAPVAQAAKQETAKAEAQAEKTEEKQLPSTGEGADANLLALGLVGVLGGFGLLAQKKKED